jgi:excisionase family DNA binding protein
VSESRIRLKEAAARLGVGTWTLRRWAKAGAVTYYLVGNGQYMEFEARDILALHLRMRHEGKTPAVE